ncbi:MAG: hypothetical protein OK422_02755 [Thaumarchaeota archaeon]|nr:hypothetical protein [Nitrososphaerota archaeon]
MSDSTEEAFKAAQKKVEEAFDAAAQQFQKDVERAKNAVLDRLKA